MLSPEGIVMDYRKLTEKKAELDRHRGESGGLPSDLVKNLDDWFRVELTYSSNAIEGNTLTRKETALVVEKGLTVGGKSLKEHLEASNHAGALDWMRRVASRKEGRVSEQEIMEIHGLILRGIDDANAARYRNVAVRIAGSRVILPNPLKVPDLMEEFGKWLDRSEPGHPVELASEAHYRLVTIHPFADGNGRTARLLMNLILLMHGYPPALIRKRDRLAYISSLEKAQLGGSKEDYLRLIARAVTRSLGIYLKAIVGGEEEQAAGDESRRLLKIGELAKRAGETVPTVRYWTGEGLLEVAERTPFNYSLYGTEMIGRIEKIQMLKKKRHTLREIREILRRTP